MIGEVKLRMVVDTALEGTGMHDRMQSALERLRDEVKRLTGGQIGVSWTYIYHDYDENDISWVSGTYNGSPHHYPTAGWVSSMNAQYDDENTSVMLVIHPGNWKNPDAIIGGINYFQTQVIHPMEYWSIGAWKLTLEHELLHSFDNRAAQFPGVDFNAAVGKNRSGKVITNWDADVVHEAWPNGAHINIFDYVWDRAVDEIATIYPYKNTMAKPLIKFTDENHVYMEVAPHELVHLESPETLEKVKLAGLVTEPILVLGPESRPQYKKVAVLAVFPATDL